MRTNRVNRYEYQQPAVIEPQIVESNYTRIKNTGIQFDFSAGKLMVVSAMFLVLFALPIGLYNSWQARVGGSTSNVAVTYSDRPTVTDAGRVAGVSTASQSSAATSQSQANIAGIPLNYFLIIAGIAVMAVPTVILLRR